MQTPDECCGWVGPQSPMEREFLDLAVDEVRRVSLFARVGYAAVLRRRIGAGGEAPVALMGNA